MAADAGIESGDKLSATISVHLWWLQIRFALEPKCKEAQDLVSTPSNYQNYRLECPIVYREFSIEDECMWDPVDNQGFGTMLNSLPTITKRLKTVHGP